MNKANLIRMGAVVALLVVLFVLPRLWSWSGLPAAVIILLVIGMFFLVRRHASTTGYRCPACDHTFAVTALTDFLSPHLGNIKMLRCPACGVASWCPEIGRAEVTSPAPDDSPPPPRKTTSLYVQTAVVTGVYLLLWGYTFSIWPRLPETIPPLAVLKIPLATTLLPILLAVFCFYGASRGYRSRIYLAVTLFVGIFMLLAIWIQHDIFAGVG